MDSNHRAARRRRQPSKPAMSKCLTFERAASTLPAPHEPEASEADDLMVKHFLRTLAEISLAIASRKASS